MFCPLRNKIFTKITFFTTGFLCTLIYFKLILRTSIQHFPENLSDFSGDQPWSEEDVEEWDLSGENIPDLEILSGNSYEGPLGVNRTCAKFPNLFDIHFSNLHYQVQGTEGSETYFFYNAYLDVRSESPAFHRDHQDAHYFVRILAMVDHIGITHRNGSLRFCQFWLEKHRYPVITNIAEIKMIWHPVWGTRGHYYPYLVTCWLPRGLLEMPVSVSLVPQKCANATNNLILNHRDRFRAVSPRPKSSSIAVCVKALDYPNSRMQSKLIEWIEALRFLGAKKIFFYEYFVSSEIRRILDYYESQGFVDVTKTTLPGNLPNHPQLRHLYIQKVKTDKRLTELLPYNDCLYRNMYDYEYIAVLDTDEIIVPEKNVSWSNLIQTVKDTDVGPAPPYLKLSLSFCFANFYFLDGMLAPNDSRVSHIPPQFHMLRHVHRARTSTGKRFMKCFHSTQDTVAVHNHFPLFCQDGRKCSRHYVDPARAQMNHYRSTCVKEIKNCSKYLQDSILDKKLWRFEKEIARNVDSALRKIS